MANENTATAQAYPNLVPWKPGESGNPGGRPKILKEYQEWLKENALDKVKATLLELLDCRDPKVRLAACKEVADRLFGRPNQSITGNDGQPIDLAGHGRFIEDLFKKLAERK